MGKHAKLKEEQKWSEEKLHLENARKLRGIYFIDPKRHMHLMAQDVLESSTHPHAIHERLSLISTSSFSTSN